MKKNEIILWTARTLSIVFACFISIFALDVFDEENEFWNTIPALMLHLIPTFIIILIIIFSWNRPLIGGLFYTFLGIAYIVYSWGKFDWTVYFIIAGPLFFLGILYFIFWYQKKHPAYN